MGLGVGCIGVGTLHRTGAFSSVTAGRGIAVSAATDPNALLGIDQSEYPPTLINNSENLSMSVILESTAIEFDVNGDGTFEEPATLNLTADESREIELEGDDDTVEISVTLSKDHDTVGSIVLDRFFEVPQIAAIREVVGSVEKAGNSGKYEFSLTNESDDTVTLDGFGVNSTTPEAAQVGGRNNDNILEAEETQIIDQIITVGGSIVDVIDGQEVELQPSVEVTFEFLRFRDDENKNFGVDDVDMAVRAEDGSSAVVALRTD